MKTDTNTRVRVSCPVCRDPDASGYSSYVRGDVLRCRKDGVWIAQLEPNFAIFNETAWPSRNERIIDGVIGAAALYARGTRLHDFGCGDGGTMVAARETGFEVSGNDIDPHAIAAVHALGMPCYERLDEVADRSLDVLLSMCVFPQHIREWEPVAESFNRALKPSGIVVLDVPDRSLRRFVGQLGMMLGSRWMAEQVVLAGAHTYAFDQLSG